MNIDSSNATSVFQSILEKRFEITHYTIFGELFEKLEDMSPFKCRTQLNLFLI